jgi:gluconolactonase
VQRPTAWNRTIATLAAIPHCEGVAVGPDGAIWAADEVGRLFRIDPAGGGHEQVADVGGFGCGLCCDGRGDVYVCVYDRGAIVRVDARTREVDVYCSAVDGGPLRRPNWNLFAADGTMYVSDSCEDDVRFLDEKTGRVVAVPPGGGEATVVPAPPIGYSNGMALGPDGALYVVETFLDPRILVFRDGDVSVYTELPQTVPDGLAFDDEGGLIVSMFQPNLIVRIPPGGGDPETVVEDWAGQRLLTPTNVAFCGPDRRTLAIASLCGFVLYKLETPWRGLPLQYPELPSADQAAA